MTLILQGSVLWLFSTGPDPGDSEPGCAQAEVQWLPAGLPEMEFVCEWEVALDHFRKS
jgi:hypothetical protein